MTYPGTDMDGQLAYHLSDQPSDIQSSSYQRLTQDRGINSSRTVHFFAEGMHDSYIDLSQCYLKTTFRVVNEDGSTLNHNRVFPTENYGTNLWNQVSVSLNNSPLPPGNDYPYTAMMIDLLGGTPDARRTVMDPLSGFDIPNYGSSKIKHALPGSYIRNKAECKDSRLITVYDRIHSDFMMSCSQLLPSRMGLGITLTRSRDDFVLGEETLIEMDPTTKKSLNHPLGSYKVEIQAVSLFVKRVTLNPAARSMVEGGLASGGRLHYQRLHTAVFACALGTRTWNWHNCFNNIAPRRAFVALVSQEGYSGSLRRAGSFLESARVSTVRFSLDGREVMAEPYRCDFKYKDGRVDPDNSDASSAFAGLHQVLGTLFNPRSGLGVSLPFFVNGATVFAVGLGHSEGLGSAPGSLDVSIEFAAQTDEPLMVIVMGEYPTIVAFDSNRQLKPL